MNVKYLNYNLLMLLAPFYSNFPFINLISHRVVVEVQWDFYDPAEGKLDRGFSEVVFFGGYIYVVCRYLCVVFSYFYSSSSRNGFQDYSFYPCIDSLGLVSPESGARSLKDISYNNCHGKWVNSSGLTQSGMHRASN